MGRIDRRDDVSPKAGEREYGDVEFADPTEGSDQMAPPAACGAAES